MINLDDLPSELLPFKENILATVKPVIEIILSPAENLELWASKVGGKPYLPLEVDYPHNENGEPLGFLAQFNLAELPKTDELPQSGILAFFVDYKEILRCKVLYFENVTTDCLTIRQNFDEIFKQFDENILPFKLTAQFSPHFELKQKPISSNDFQMQERFFGKSIANTEIGDDLAEWVYDLALFDGNGHHLLGYPYFTQEDVRIYDVPKDYILLFQLDSDTIGKLEISWGDGGVANFFIHPNDLKNKDFSKVIFCWDCH